MKKFILVGSLCGLIELLNPFSAHAADKFRIVLNSGAPKSGTLTVRVGIGGNSYVATANLLHGDTAEQSATKLAAAINAVKPGAAKSVGSFVYIDTELRRLEVGNNRAGISGSIEDVDNGTTANLKKGAKIVVPKPNAGASLIDLNYSPISLGIGVDSSNHFASHDLLSSDTEELVYNALLADLAIPLNCTPDECISNPYEFSSFARVEFRNNYFFGVGLETVDVPAPIPVLGIYSAFAYARRLRRLTKSLKAHDRAPIEPVSSTY